MTLCELQERERAIISPPSRMSVSQWADKHAYIPEEGNAEPGKYRCRRMPHQMAMLDDVQDPHVAEIFWMMASQIAGKTLCLILMLEYSICQMRRSAVMVRRTKDDGIEWIRDKFLPAVDETPQMKGLLVEPRKRDSGSTMLSRKFPGGTLKVIGAKSPGKFRGFSAPTIFQDEIDSYETIKEGDPCALADRGAITFSDAWKLKSSTPTLAGFSRIHAGFLEGDQQYYFVPCPCCGAFQSLKTEQMKFTFTVEEFGNLDKGHPNEFEWSIGNFSNRDTKRAIYVCEVCKRGWTDSQRISAILSGHPENAAVIVQIDGRILRAEWRATAPFKGIRSRHLNGMYATIGLKKMFVSYLHQFAEGFLKAKKDGRDSLMVWTNIFKTEVYEDEAEKIEWKDLLDRAEVYAVPIQVMLIVFGLDIQTDRVEVMSLGFGDEQESWLLDYKVIYGDFDMPQMQERVEEYLTGKRFTHPVLGEMGYEAGAIDTGHQTRVKAAFRFCKKHKHRNYFAIKGFDNALGAIYTTAMERAFQINRFNFNVDYLKSIIFGNLKNKEPGPNFIHFKAGAEFTERFFQGICSEKRVAIPQKNGGVVFHWKKIASTQKNEPLDTLVYCFGVFEVLRKAGKVEWIARKWKEVCAKLPKGEKIEPTKEYVLKPAEEAKMPDLTVLPEKRKPNIPRWKQIASGSRRMGGMWNPLRL
jgi:phage terminase large subunit GpA-like protein